ncbi:MAG TPA: tetratricopeptide repeat protein, partial [Vicinamibacterales bacterium]|nr:tetratricopeptide repeat protein [Vicinamibacterales bacterium]
LLLQAEGRLDAAIGHYRDALRERPDLETQFNLGVALALTGGRPEAVGLLRQVLLRRPDWPAALGALAWILAVTPDGSASERDEAVDLAQHAVELTQQRNAAVLDILATALAATGQFARAVTTAERAVAAAEAGSDPRTTAAIRQRLELFRRQSPYHEMP